MKRDLKADLELCNKATPGPWEAEDGLADPMVVMGRDDSHYFYVHTEWDAQFIAQSREGWPHAIERALELEEELTRCGNTLVELTIALKDVRKRADKAEALARELVEALEKSLVNVAWELAEQEHLLNLAKEVLGDE